MADSNHWKMYFTCPFIACNYKSIVKCEMGTAITFPCSESIKEYLKKYCAGDYKQCSVAKMLIEYYERKFKDE